MQQQVISLLPQILRDTGPIRARYLRPELHKFGLDLTKRDLNRILHFQNINPGIKQDNDYRWGFSPVEGLIHSMLQRGAVEIKKPSRIPSSLIVYVVVNGNNILAVGEGQPIRLLALMKQSDGKEKHQKTFIVAASNVLHGPNHRYFALAVPSKYEGLRIEGELHRMFGETLVDGIDCFDRYGIAQGMLQKIYDLKGIDTNHPLHNLLQRAVSDGGSAVCSLFWRNETRTIASDFFNHYY